MSLQAEAPIRADDYVTPVLVLFWRKLAVVEPATALLFPPERSVNNSTSRHDMLGGFRPSLSAARSSPDSETVTSLSP